MTIEFLPPRRSPARRRKSLAARLGPGLACAIVTGLTIYALALANPDCPLRLAPDATPNAPNIDGHLHP